MVTGVAEQIAAKIHSLVCLDSFVPENGKSLFDYLRAEQSGQMRDDAAQNGEGYKITPIPAAAFAVTAQDAAWVDRCASSSHWRHSSRMLEVSGRQVPKRVYLLAAGWEPSPFQPFGTRFKDDRGWRSSASPAGAAR